MMLAFFRDSPVLLALIALMPAAISWWSGRQLIALVDDPILPERMNANQRRNSVAFVIAFAGLASLSPQSIVWTGPLVFLSTHVAAYPMRQAIFGETWSLVTYLSFFMRMLAGLFGFWTVLASLPALSRMAGTADWIVASVVGALLLLWNARYPDAVRYCMRTTPLENPELLARCRQLAEQCALPQPRFETIPLRGGVLANALALPSLGTSSVLFTETLLARLDPREIAAICAHELAHLEHYNPRRLGRMNAVVAATIFTGALWSPVMRRIGLAGSAWPMLIWLVLLTGTLVLRARGKQQQETVCDVRAVALTGDPEALIGALTKLYTIARIPRRVELRHEQADSHPSLARRIKDIRRAAGAAPAHLESAAVFTGSDGRTSVTFDQATLRWTGADAVTHSVEYTNLSELRIDATRASGPRLMARSTQSTAWEMPLAREDVVRMQLVLDRVDSRLGEPAVVAAVPQKFSRPGIGFVALIALILGQVSVAVIALLACVRMAAPLLAAAGLAAVTAAALAFRDSPSELRLLMAAPVGLTGFVLLMMAWAHRKVAHASLRGPLAIIGAMAACAIVMLTATGLDVVRLHQSVRQSASATVLLLGLATALGLSRVRASQLAGLAAALAGGILTIVGSPAFLDRFGRDPLLVDGPPIRWLTVGDTMLEQFALPGATSRIRLSPNGRQIAALHQSGSDGETSTFLIGRAGEEFLSLDADDLIFVDDDHVLLCDSNPQGTTLRKARLRGAGEVVWTGRIDDLTASTMTFDSRSQRWRLTGWDGNHGMVRAEGVFGNAAMDVTRWPAAPTSEAWIDSFTTAGPDALVVETRYDGGPFRRLLPPRWSWITMLIHPHNQESRFWTLNASGRTHLGTSRFGSDCHAGVLSNDALLCHVFDGTRTRFVSLATSGAISGLGWIEGRFASDPSVVSGWITGWAGSTPVAIRLSTAQALRLAVQEHSVGHLAVAGERLAAVTFGRDGISVRTYAVDRVPGREAKR